MSRITQWKNVGCSLHVPLCRDETTNKWLRENGTPVPCDIAVFLNDTYPDLLDPNHDSAELNVGFKSSGYSDPGSYGGRMEDAEPPDREEERVIFGAATQTGVRLPDSLNCDLAAWLQAEIDELELELDLTPPERDDCPIEKEREVRERIERAEAA